MTIALAAVAGVAIGLSLGALGSGGSILAVPVLVFVLDQSPSEATTGALVVVAVTALTGAVAAYRSGTVLLGRGVAFGIVAVGGAALGARLSAAVPEAVLLAAFAMLMLVVAGVMAWRQLQPAHGSDGSPDRWRHGIDDPIISFSPTFVCRCPRAAKIAVTATGVGLLTGLLGVGGGFLVVPALLLALSLPMQLAAGTSLVVISVTSAAALAVRAGIGITPDWSLVLLLAAVSAVAGVAGVRLAASASTHHLSIAFTVLVVGVAIYTAGRALPALA